MKKSEEKTIELILLSIVLIVLQVFLSYMFIMNVLFSNFLDFIYISSPFLYSLFIISPTILLLFIEYKKRYLSAFIANLIGALILLYKLNSVYYDTSYTIGLTLIMMLYMALLLIGYLIDLSIKRDLIIKNLGRKK